MIFQNYQYLFIGNFCLMKSVIFLFPVDRANSNPVSFVCVVLALISRLIDSALSIRKRNKILSNISIGDFVQSIILFTCLTLTMANVSKNDLMMKF